MPHGKTLSGGGGRFDATTQRRASCLYHINTGARAKAWCLSIHAKAFLSVSLSVSYK
jgi:hypothetical protein